MSGRTVLVRGGLLAATLCLLALDGVLARAFGTAPASFYVRELAVPLIWSTVGLIAWHLRPDSRSGLLMTAVGLLLAVNATAGFQLQGGGPQVAGYVELAIALTPFQTPLGAQALLSYPTGRLPDPAARRLLRAMWTYGAVAGVLGVLYPNPGYLRTCSGECPTRLFALSEDLATVERVASAVSLGWLLAVPPFGWLLFRRMSRAGHRERRVLALPFLAIGVVFAMFVVDSVLGLSDADARVSGAGPGGRVFSTIFQLVATVAIPGSFLLGLLRERLGYASVADLVRAIDTARPLEIEPALARALGDPTLRLGFPVGEGYVDQYGRPLPGRPPESQRITPLGDATPPVAVLFHDRSLAAEPRLLQAAGAAAALALENARLQATVQAQLAEVRASRQRIVEAGDAERRRLERNLHDGAQQRLFATGLTLRLVRAALPPEKTPATDLVAQAEAELGRALQDLRELAQGIHPAVLTDEGLWAAVHSLRLRAAGPATVTVVGDDPGRLPPSVEVAAYFAVSEALTNAVKHAGATRVTIALECNHDRLVVRIADNGAGGAVLSAGSGLRGLADRAAAIGGGLTVRSPAGEGTSVTVELPCG